MSSSTPKRPTAPSSTNTPSTSTAGGPSATANPSSNNNTQDDDEPAPSILNEEDIASYLEPDESLDLDLENFNKKIWLVRLPRYLADKWKDVDSLDGSEIGKVRIRSSDEKNPLKVKLVLKETQKNQDIPHEYDLTVLNTQVKNSYVFNEKTLNKFKTELTEMSEMPTQPKLQPINKKQQQFKAQPQKFRVSKETNPNNKNNGTNGNYSSKKFTPYVKTIPKKTSLVGAICHDCQLVPSTKDKKYSQLLSQRNKLRPAKPRPTVTLLDEIPGIIQSNAGPSIKGNNSSIFLRQNRAGISSKGEGRAIRMPKKDLLDLLFRLFGEYEYWSMKGLKERTRQPESYLKESLDSIATLIKKGPYTSKYNLKPEYKRLRDAERAERLGIDLDENNEKDDDDDDDDNIEMIDVA